MELIKPLSIAFAGFTALTGALAYFVDEKSWAVATGIVGFFALALAICAWRWKWEFVSRAVEPDWTGYEAFRHIRLSIYARKDSEIQNWFNSICQNASERKITIFGRAAMDIEDSSKSPLQAIRPSYWLDHAIEETTMIDPPEDTGGSENARTRREGSRPRAL